MPRVWGAIGVWIALHLADLLTMIVAIIFQKKTFMTEGFTKPNGKDFESCSKEV
ncbi:MAG: hypothetical protein LR001_02785 [Clostridiales bacterium]|nr:hypothetical protein [Clostridiales bacterium]